MQKKTNLQNTLDKKNDFKPGGCGIFVGGHRY